MRKLAEWQQKAIDDFAAMTNRDLLDALRDYNAMGEFNQCALDDELEKRLAAWLAAKIPTQLQFVAGGKLLRPPSRS